MVERSSDAVAPSKLLPEALNLEAVRSFAVAGMQSAMRLLSYWQYLAAIRKQKAARHYRSIFEADVVAQARGAAVDARSLGHRALSILRQLRNAGALEQALQRVERNARDVGKLDLKAAGLAALQTEHAREALRREGIDSSLLDALRTQLERVQVVVEPGEHGTVRIDGTAVALSKATQRPATLAQALSAGSFDRIVDALGSDEPFLAAPVAAARNSQSRTVDVYEGVAAQASALAHELVRHVRKIEDVGLATYEGGDPATIGTILIIAGVVMIVVGGAIVVYCKSKHKDMDEDECKEGIDLLTLGLFLLVSGAITRAKTGQGPQVVPLQGDSPSDRLPPNDTYSK
jgi:hypothetical protein